MEWIPLLYIWNRYNSGLSVKESKDFDKFLLYIAPSNPLTSLERIKVVYSPKQAEIWVFWLPTKNVTWIFMYKISLIKLFSFWWWNISTLNGIDIYLELMYLKKKNKKLN